MTDQIETILFDMGGTLRDSIPNGKTVRQEKARCIMELIGADAAVEEFAELLTARGEAYVHWSRETLVELNEAKLWTQWMLPDFPAGKVGKIAIQLNQLWREATGTRTIFSETKEVLTELFRRGYRLGIVSNTTSSIETPQALKDLELAGCLETVILSCQVGMRKPDPAILLEATSRMGVQPAKCAYIGDRVDRDVISARKAGFAKTIIRHAHLQTEDEQINDSTFTPDHIIEDLRALLEIFPPRFAPEPDIVYNASLSTMYAINNFPALDDFFEFARRAGFARIELNHKVTSAMLDGIDLSRFQFSSVHEPCPADISGDELKKRDWLVSSTNEENRRAGVKAIQRSIDLASQLSASAVVIHVGQAHPETGVEKKLHTLIASGQRGSDEYREVQRQMIQARAEAAEAGFESVKKSMVELLAYAEKSGVCLGVENRYHYMEFPNPDELEILLGLAGLDRIGFIYDVGHAQTLDRLGFYPHEEWLQRFAPRIIGTHLHDVLGTTDHYAPGLGDVDFSMVARYLPENAFRTCEFQAFNTPEQLNAGLKVLAKHGCVQLQS